VLELVEQLMPHLHHAMYVPPATLGRVLRVRADVRFARRARTGPPLWATATRALHAVRATARQAAPRREQTLLRATLVRLDTLAAPVMACVVVCNALRASILLAMRPIVLIVLLGSILPMILSLVSIAMPGNMLQPVVPRHVQIVTLGLLPMLVPPGVLQPV